MSVPEFVLQYAAKLEQQATLKIERAQLEKRVIEWLATQPRSAIHLADGKRLKLSNDLDRLSLTRSHLQICLFNYFQFCRPQDNDSKITQIASEATAFIWLGRQTHLVQRIRQTGKRKRIERNVSNNIFEVKY